MEVKDERRSDLFDKVRNSSVLKKIRGIKNIRLIAAIFIIAVALIIYSNVAADRAASESTAGAPETSMDSDESRLAGILEGLEGVGRVETMITRGEDDEVVGIIVIAEGA